MHNKRVLRQDRCPGKHGKPSPSKSLEVTTKGPRIFNPSYGPVRICAAAVVPMIDDVAKTGRTNSMKVYRRGTGDEKKSILKLRQAR